jgi:hypothetical protein
VSNHPLVGRSALTAASLVAAIAAVAATVRLAGATPAARSALAFEFSRRPATPEEALAVAAGNLRLASAILLAAVLVGLRPEIRPALDVVVGALAGLNATTAGIAIAAYGTRLLRVVAAHASLELAAFAVAGGAYLGARRRALDGHQLMTAAAASSLLLAAAALVETYVQIGVGR